MQTDQTVISLRPGGGGALRGTRFLNPRFDSSSSSDAFILRPHSSALAPALKVATTLASLSILHV